MSDIGRTGDKGYTGYMLDLCETFLSWQGEGPSTGRLAYFVRFNDCPLRCNYCDTKYTWQDKNLVPVEDVISSTLSGIAESKANLCVLTGGEPLQQNIIALSSLIEKVSSVVPVEIETSGFYHINIDSVTQWNVSPKLKNSGNVLITKYSDSLKLWANNDKAIFKFVVEKLEDFEEIDTLTAEFNIDPSRTWIMPEGVTRERQLELVPILIDPIKARGFNLSLRMHVIIWGNRRGV